MSELVKPMSAEIVLPGTGELVDIVTPDGAGYTLAYLDRWYTGDGELRDFLVDRLHEEAERRGTKTLHLERVTVVVWGGPDAKVETDGYELRERLRAAGLPEERIEAAVPMVITYKPDGRVLRQLRGANPAYAAAIDASQTKVHAKRGAKAQ